jgi:hypothetical protein
MSNTQTRPPFLACNSEVSIQSALSSAEQLDNVMRDFANGDRKALGRISMHGMAEVLSFIRQAALAQQPQPSTIPADAPPEVVRAWKDGVKHGAWLNTPQGSGEPVALCGCKDRPAVDCPGEWEPGCDLGNNPKHARRAPPAAAHSGAEGVAAVWLYDFTANGQAVRDWMTTSKEEAFSAGHSNQRRFLPEKANAPGGAFVGESDACARLGLADANGTCEHKFALDPASSIELCSKCGVSELLAKKLARPTASKPGAAS